MTFTFTSAPPTGDLSNREVALWYARKRSGDTNGQNPSARPDEDWYLELESDARPSTRAFGTTVIGTVIYRPFRAAANHIRMIPQHLLADSGTTFTDPREAAAALDDYQDRLDARYGTEDAPGESTYSALLVRV